MRCLFEMHAMIIVIYVKCLYYLGYHIRTKQKKYRISHLCRVHWPRHTANGPSFAVCQAQAAHGKRPSPCQLGSQQKILAVGQPGHTAKLCRVPDILHATKSFFADDCLPCDLCRVRHTTNHLSCAFGPLPCAPSTQQKGYLP